MDNTRWLKEVLMDPLSLNANHHISSIEKLFSEAVDKEQLLVQAYIVGCCKGITAKIESEYEKQSIAQERLEEGRSHG